MLLVCFRISTFSYLGLRKSSFGFLCGLAFLFQKAIHSLRVSSVILSFSNELFGVVSLFLRRCIFQVVSVTGVLKLRLT